MGYRELGAQTTTIQQTDPALLEATVNQPTKGDLHAIVDAQINGANPSVGAGAVDATTIRVSQATDDAGVVSLAAIAARLLSGGAVSNADLLAAILADTALIPADPAREGGNLATLNGKIPADPAKESGKLTEIDTALDALIAKINDYPTLGVAAEVLAVSNVNAALAVALAAGTYLLWCSCDVWWLQAEAPVAVWEDVSCKPLPAGQLVPVTLAAQKIGAITNGATGKLIAIPVS